MSKTTTKKTKKTPTRTAVASKTSKRIVKKAVAKKSSTPAKAKTVSVVKPAKEATKTLDKNINFVEVAKKFFTNQKNLIILVVALLFLGAGYLLKDVFIVAMVNGKPIYRWTVVQKLEEQGGRQVLDSLITETLVKQAISDSGIKIDQVEIDAAIKEIEDRIVSQGMTLDQALEQQGMTRNQLVDDIVLQKSAERLVAENIEVTDEEVATYMEENSDFFPEGSNLDEMKGLVREQLKSSKVNVEIQTWVQGLQDNAKIIYMKKYDLAL